MKSGPKFNDALRPCPSALDLVAVDCILTCNDFDERAVSALATRQNYPDAAWLLLREFASNYATEGEIIPVLFKSPPRLAPYRLVLAVGGTEFNDRSTVTLALLKNSNSANAKIVLALLGQIEWTTACRQRRAAYCLHALVKAFRERA